MGSREEAEAEAASLADKLGVAGRDVGEVCLGWKRGWWWWSTSKLGRRGVALEADVLALVSGPSVAGEGVEEEDAGVEYEATTVLLREREEEKA